MSGQLATLEQARCSPHGELAPPVRGSRSGMSGQIWRHYHDLVEGGFVIYHPNVTARQVIDSPMCDATLAPGTVSRFDRSDVDGLIFAGMQLWNAAAGHALTRAMIDQTYSGLDSVAPDVHAALRAGMGAHVGIRRGDVIEYPDATAPVFYPPDTEGQEQMSPVWWRDQLWTAPALTQGETR